MRIITRTEMKRLLKNSDFWNYFPEYKDLYDKINTKKIKLGCCNMSDELFKEVLNRIKSNPIKWKEYLKTDKIQMYDGRLIEV